MESTPSSPWAIRDPIFIYFGGLAATILALLVAVLFGFIDIDTIDSDEQLPRLIMVAALAQYAAMYLGLKLLSALKGTGDFKNDFHLHVSSRDWPFFFYGVGALFALGIALTLFLDAIGVEAPTQEVVEAARASDSLGEKAVILLAIAVLAPILEEMLFRGVLQDALKVRMSVTGAVWITGIVFGLVHLTDPAALALVPALIVLGIVLGLVREHGSGSLSRPILMHMGFNAVTAVGLIRAIYSCQLRVTSFQLPESCQLPAA
ncbi:MAG: CPBP family intramembrane glutamic endopeptidase [Acidimicrobiia bacterium]